MGSECQTCGFLCSRVLLMWGRTGNATQFSTDRTKKGLIEQEMLCVAELSQSLESHTRKIHSIMHACYC